MDDYFNNVQQKTIGSMEDLMQYNQHLKIYLSKPYCSYSILK